MKAPPGACRPTGGIEQHEGTMTEETRLYNTIAPLRNVAALLTLIDRIQNRAFGLPGMGTFYGPSGYGKTTGATYATNRYQACHVQIQTLWHPKTMLQEIATELGLRYKTTATAPVLFNLVAAELAQTNRPLLLDEADYLCKEQMIEVVRGLHETSGVPVILIGEEMLPQKLRAWERVHGRMLDWVGAEAATIEDVGHLAPIYARGVTIEEDLRKLLLQAAQGSIRRISINLATIAEFAAVQGLTRIDAATWGRRPLFTGEAPAPRRDVAATQRAEIAQARRRAS